MWPQCGAFSRNASILGGADPRRMTSFRALHRQAYVGRNCRFRRSTGPFSCVGRLTITVAEDYIRSLGRAAARRDGASAKPLTVHTVTEHSAMLLMAMFASPRRMYGLSSSPAGAFGSRPGRSRKVPGCLTSESEERETWTAESLRTAFVNGKAFAFSVREYGHGRDFGGRRFRSTLWILRSASSARNKVGPRQTL